MRRRHVGYLRLRPAQLIRRGCVGCLTILVLLLLLLAALIGLGLVLGTQIASAAEPAPSALLLSEAIAEAPAAPTARGVFAQRNLTISVPAGRVILASAG